ANREVKGDRGSVEGKTVLVTGAAKGIGLAVAHHFAREGARVALIDRDRDALTEAADSVERIANGAALALPAAWRGRRRHPTRPRSRTPCKPQSSAAAGSRCSSTTPGFISRARSTPTR